MVERIKSITSKLPKKIQSIALVSGGIIIGAAGVGYAAIPDASGVITACYTTNVLNTKTHIIDAATTANCPTGETKITWNQKGVKGDTGATGPQGPGVQSAYAQFNPDGTLDASYSTNITAFKIVDDNDGSGAHTACFNISFLPKEGLATNNGTPMAIFLGSRSGDVLAEIDGYCGAGYNAAADNVNPDGNNQYRNYAFSFFR